MGMTAPKHPVTFSQHSGFRADQAHALSVADLLELPIVKGGRPEVLAGEDLADREVRWVHTSEIYEISPLLKGGEVLLTTGLGLVGADPGELRNYVTGLAERSIAALVLELGRTFVTPPEAMVARARETGLPLVTLRSIVPFIEITESVHSLLLSEEVTRLRLMSHIDSTTTSVLLSASGLVTMLQELAHLADCPVLLYGRDGHLVAASDAPHASPTTRHARSRFQDLDVGRPHAPVELLSHPWGHLVIDGRPSLMRTLIAQRGGTAVALELGRAGGASGGSNRRRAGSLLLRDIFGRQYSSVDEIIGRAAALGVTMRPECVRWGSAWPSTRRPPTRHRRWVRS